MPQNKMLHFDPSELTVITPITNPLRFWSRHDLYANFEEQMKKAGVNFITVETAFGRRHFHFTQANDPNDVQLRSDQELWLKEASINVGIQHAMHRFPNTKYIAWIDGDITFNHPQWAQEIIEQLQHFKIVQVFSHCVDLGPEGQPIKTDTGFIYCWRQNDCKPPQGAGYGGYYGYGAKQGFWHCGYGWAARVEALNALSSAWAGPLIDHCILGSGDHSMAMGLIGEMQRSYPSGMSKSFIDRLQSWQDLAIKHIQYDVGYVPGTITHHWHGKKADRKYVDRWQILLRNKFDPDLDIRRDIQGLWQLTDRNWRLRVEIEAYFRARHEDSIDL